MAQIILPFPINNPMKYEVYRKIISKLISKGKSTGLVQSDDLLHYSKLNETRMNRLDKTISISEEVFKKIVSISKPQTWLVLTEGWCGDAAQIVPIVNKLAACNSKITIHFILRDENDEIMQQFLTNNGKAIPKVIFIDENNRVFNHWGPRPEGAKNLIINYKAKYGIVDENAKIELQKWYLENKGIEIQKEIVALLV